eukprot:6811471-Alexandrium_andersonii.AAC.1
MPAPDAATAPRVPQATEGPRPLVVAAAAGGVEDRSTRELPPAGAEIGGPERAERVLETRDGCGVAPPPA